MHLSTYIVAIFHLCSSSGTTNNAFLWAYRINWYLLLNLPNNPILNRNISLLSLGIVWIMNPLSHRKRVNRSSKISIILIWLSINASSSLTLAFIKLIHQVLNHFLLYLQIILQLCLLFPHLIYLGPKPPIFLPQPLHITNLALTTGTALLRWSTSIFGTREWAEEGRDSVVLGFNWLRTGCNLRFWLWCHWVGFVGL